MARYHRSKNDEKVLCEASVQSCPRDHVEADSPEEAERLFEEMNKEQAGGTFKKVTRESDAEPLDLIDGESMTISDYNDAHTWDSVEVVHQDGEYFVDVTVTDDMYRTVPDSVRERADMMYGEHSDEGREYMQRYLDNRMGTVMDGLEKRYPDIELDPGAELNTFTFSHGLGTEAPTQEEALNAAFDKTSSLEFINDMDPGTFGAEDRSREIREHLENYDKQKLSNPEQTDVKEQQKFVQDFVSSAEQDARMTYEEQYFEEHGEEPEEEVELSAEAKKDLTVQAAKFYKRNEGDLNAWKESRGSQSIGGHDAYMVAAEHGVGYTDNYDAEDPDNVIVSNRLADSAETEMRLGEAEVGDDGKIYFLK